jgi:hypothetical protein
MDYILIIVYTRSIIKVLIKLLLIKKIKRVKSIKLLLTLILIYNFNKAIALSY